MAVIELTTLVAAPRERVFDLARSVDVHQAFAEGTAERAVDGVTAGLMELNDEVTWEATHLCVRQRMRVRITRLERPAYVQDAMVSGAFARMVHDHHFATDGARTVMHDRFEFAAPFGIVGRIVEDGFLTAYMRRFLIRRNAALQRIAESDEWRRYLDER